MAQKQRPTGLKQPKDGKPITGVTILNTQPAYTVDGHLLQSDRRSKVMEMELVQFTSVVQDEAISIIKVRFPFRHAEQLARSILKELKKEDI